MAIASPPDPFSILLNQSSALIPQLFGSGTKTEQTSVDPEALGQSKQLYDALLQRGTSTSQADGVIADIIYRTQLAFAPVLGEEHAAGGYNSTTKKLLADNAAASAVRASAQAVFEDQQKALQMAAQVSGQQMQATKGVTTKTSAPLPAANVGKAGLAVLAASAAGKLMKGSKGKAAAAPTGGQVADSLQTAFSPEEQLAMSRNPDVASLDQAQALPNVAAAAPDHLADSLNATFDTDFSAAPGLVQSADQAAEAASQVADTTANTVSTADTITDAADAASTVSDVSGAASTVADVGSAASDAGDFSDIGSFFDNVSDWFKDGGMVGRDGQSIRHIRPVKPHKDYRHGGKVKGYADGGEVDTANQPDLLKKKVRPIPNEQDPNADGLDEFDAVNSVFSAGGSFGNVVSSIADAMSRGGSGTSAGVSGSFLGYDDPASAPDGSPAGDATPGAFTTNNAMAAVSMALALSNPLSLALNLFSKISNNPPSPGNSLTGPTDEINATFDTDFSAPPAPTGSVSSPTGPSDAIAATFDTDFSAPVAVADTASDAPSAPTDAGEGDASTAPAPDGGSSTAAAGDGSTGDGGTGGDGSGAGAEKDGGEIDGAGTGTSDSILAHVSDGEYIIPADVVSKLGVEFFDDLLEEHHSKPKPAPKRRAVGGRR